MFNTRIQNPYEDRLTRTEKAYGLMQEEKAFPGQQAVNKEALAKQKALNGLVEESKHFVNWASFAVAQAEQMRQIQLGNEKVDLNDVNIEAIKAATAELEKVSDTWDTDPKNYLIQLLTPYAVHEAASKRSGKLNSILSECYQALLDDSDEGKLHAQKKAEDALDAMLVTATHIGDGYRRYFSSLNRQRYYAGRFRTEPPNVLWQGQLLLALHAFVGGKAGHRALERLYDRYANSVVLGGTKLKSFDERQARVHVHDRLRTSIPELGLDLKVGLRQMLKNNPALNEKQKFAMIGLLNSNNMMAKLYKEKVNSLLDKRVRLGDMNSEKTGYILNAYSKLGPVAFDALQRVLKDANARVIPLDKFLVLKELLPEDRKLLETCLVSTDEVEETGGIAGTLKDILLDPPIENLRLGYQQYGQENTIQGIMGNRNRLGFQLTQHFEALKEAIAASDNQTKLASASDSGENGPLNPVAHRQMLVNHVKDVLLEMATRAKSNQHNFLTNYSNLGELVKQRAHQVHHLLRMHQRVKKILNDAKPEILKEKKIAPKEESAKGLKPKLTKEMFEYLSSCFEEAGQQALIELHRRADRKTTSMHKFLPKPGDPRAKDPLVLTLVSRLMSIHLAEDIHKTLLDSNLIDNLLTQSGSVSEAELHQWLCNPMVDAGEQVFQSPTDYKADYYNQLKKDKQIDLSFARELLTAQITPPTEAQDTSDETLSQDSADQPLSDMMQLWQLLQHRAGNSNSLAEGLNTAQWYDSNLDIVQSLKSLDLSWNRKSEDNQLLNFLAGNKEPSDQRVKNIMRAELQSLLDKTNEKMKSQGLDEVQVQKLLKALPQTEKSLAYFSDNPRFLPEYRLVMEGLNLVEVLDQAIKNLAFAENDKSAKKEAIAAENIHSAEQMLLDAYVPCEYSALLKKNGIFLYAKELMKKRWGDSEAQQLKAQVLSHFESVVKARDLLPIAVDVIQANDETRPEKIEKFRAAYTDLLFKAMVSEEGDKQPLWVKAVVSEKTQYVRDRLYGAYSGQSQYESRRKFVKSLYDNLGLKLLNTLLPERIQNNNGMNDRYAYSYTDVILLLKTHAQSVMDQYRLGQDAIQVRLALSGADRNQYGNGLLNEMDSWIAEASNSQKPMMLVLPYIPTGDVEEAVGTVFHWQGVLAIYEPKENQVTVTFIDPLSNIYIDPNAEPVDQTNDPDRVLPWYRVVYEGLRSSVDNLKVQKFSYQTQPDNRLCGPKLSHLSCSAMDYWGKYGFKSLPNQVANINGQALRAEDAMRMKKIDIKELLGFEDLGLEQDAFELPFEVIQAFGLVV